ACGIDLGIGRFPNDYVTAHCRRRGQVTTDGCKVERRNGKDKTFERTVLHPVVETFGGDRLLPVDVAEEVYIETQEVDQFTGAVDLGLERVFTLAEHGRRIHAEPVFGSQQFCGFQEYGSTVLPACGSPLFPYI